MDAYSMISGVGRYDDILPSYVVRRIADHLGHCVRYGPPLLLQERNPHDLLEDLEKERLGLRLVGRVCASLRALELKGKSYAECFEEVQEGLQRTLLRRGSEGSSRAAERPFTAEDEGFLWNFLVSGTKNKPLGLRHWSRGPLRSAAQSSTKHAPANALEMHRKAHATPPESSCSAAPLENVSSLAASFPCRMVWPLGAQPCGGAARGPPHALLQIHPYPSLRFAAALLRPVVVTMQLGACR